MHGKTAIDQAVGNTDSGEDDAWLTWQPVIDWTKYIHQVPNVLVGKPVVRGTRLSVEFLLELTAAGVTEEQVLEQYPQLTCDALRAVFAFAAQCVREHCPVTQPPSPS